MVFESSCGGEEDNNAALSSSPPPPSRSPNAMRKDRKRIIVSNNAYTIIKQTICARPFFQRSNWSIKLL